MTGNMYVQKLNDSNHVDYLYKLLLLGDSAVGKSSLLLRFSDDSFSENQISTIGVDWKIRTLEMDGKRVKLQIWDSAGQERFRTIASSYYRGAHGVAVVFDLTDETTFKNVDSWLTEIENNAPETTRKILIGNKSDLVSERAVERERAAGLASAAGMQYMETSAKSADNVSEAFLTMTREIFESAATAGMAVRPREDLIKPEIQEGKSVKQGSDCC